MGVSVFRVRVDNEVDGERMQALRPTATKDGG
jgi:hypothetical protein